MKLIRLTSILAGMLLAVASVSTTACSKKDEDKKAKKGASTKTPKKTGKEKAKTDKGATAKKVVTEPDKGTKVAAGDDGYTVKIERPRKVGFKYKLESVGSRDMKVMANGKPAPGSSTMSWVYEAEVTVMSVDSLGRPTSEEHKISKLEVTLNGTKSTPVAKDTIVFAAIKDGKKESFTIAGVPAEPMVAGVMGEIVSLEKKGSASQDSLFGTTEKKKVGDSWDANIPALVKDFGKDMANAPMPAKAENTTARVNVVAAKEMAGIKGVSFHVVIKINKFAPKMGPLKPTLGSMSATLDVWLPADPNSIALQHDTRQLAMHVEGTADTPAGPVKMVVDMNQKATFTKTAIK